MSEQLNDLIYDWNVAGEQAVRIGGKRVEFDDETLRDGLQSPSVTDPSLDEKVRILHFMNDVGVDTADIGLPGAGPHVQKSVERLAREIAVDLDRELVDLGATIVVLQNNSGADPLKAIEVYGSEVLPKLTT